MQTNLRVVKFFLMIMGDKSTNRSLVPSGLGDVSSAEHVKKALTMAISSIPFIGGPVSLAVTEYLPDRRWQRIFDFVDELGQSIRILKDRIDQDYVSTEHFGYLFEQTFKTVAEEYETEKLQMLKGLLANSATTERPKSEEAEFFLRKIQNLSTLHLKMLRFLSSPVECLQEVGKSPEDVSGLSFAHTISQYLEGISEEMLRSVFRDLYQTRFVNTDDDNIFGVGTSQGGVRIVSDRLTQLGKDFISYCTV